MESTESELKKNSTYSDIYNEIMKTSMKVKDMVPQLCEAFERENPTKTHDELNNRIKRDMVAAGYNLDYITHCIPKKYKDDLKMIAGYRGSMVTNVQQNSQATTNVMTSTSDDNHQAISEVDFSKMASRVEQLNDDNKRKDAHIKELEEKLDLENKMRLETANADLKELTDKLEAAEMEIGFLKEGKNGEEFIKIKGSTAKRDFFYADRCGIVILKRQINELEASGIKTFQVYLQAIP